MTELFPFFFVLFAGLIFSELFTRLHLPYVTALIAAGVLLGPSGLDLVQVDSTIEFLAEIGVVFLMFIAGSEIKSDTITRFNWNLFLFTGLNGLIPAAVGFMAAWVFGFGAVAAFVFGTIFMSSSVAIIIPALEQTRLLGTRLGNVVLPAAVLEDVSSLLLLSVLLPSTRLVGYLPFWFYLPLLCILLIVLRLVIPKLRRWVLWGRDTEDMFEMELRFVFVVLLAAVVLFELLGIHAIVAGFLIGMILGDFIRGKVEHKVRTVSYGLFIPIFFFVIGMRMDLSVFVTSELLLLAAVIIFGSVSAKIVSGWLAARISGFSRIDSWLAGVATTPQLSTTLAVAFTAAEFELLPPEVISVLVALTVVTSLASPLAIRWLAGKRSVMPDVV